MAPMSAHSIGKVMPFLCHKHTMALGELAWQLCGKKREHTFGESTLVTLRVRPGRTSMHKKRTSCAELKRPSSTDCRIMSGRSENVLNHS